MSTKEEKIIKAAVNIIIEPILALLQNDPHQWSTRPCSTCSSITAIIGKPFGCILKANQSVKKEKKYKPVYFDGGIESFGMASNIEEARELGWKFLPDDIKENIGKHALKPEEFKDSWLI